MSEQFKKKLYTNFFSIGAILVLFIASLAIVKSFGATNQPAVSCSDPVDFEDNGTTTTWDPHNGFADIIVEVGESISYPEMNDHKLSGEDQDMERCKNDHSITQAKGNVRPFGPVTPTLGNTAHIDKDTPGEYTVDVTWTYPGTGTASLKNNPLNYYARRIHFGANPLLAMSMGGGGASQDKVATITVHVEGAIAKDASVERGKEATVEVKAHKKGAQPSYSNWKFVGGGETINRTVGKTNATWKGKAVQSGKISVDVKLGNAAAETIDMTLTVTARTPPASVHQNMPQNEVGRGNGHLPRSPRKQGDLGETRFVPDARSPDAASSEGEEVTSGFNKGFYYLIKYPKYSWTRVENFKNSDAWDNKSLFYKAQATGNYLIITKTQENINIHEGFLGGGDSHLSEALKDIRNKVDAKRYEKIVAFGQTKFLTAEVAISDSIIQPGKRRWENVHPTNKHIGNVDYKYPEFVGNKALNGKVNQNIQTPRLKLFRQPQFRATPGLQVVKVNADKSFTLKAVQAGVYTFSVTDSEGDSDSLTITVNP